jgi:hypothetical protein
MIAKRTPPGLPSINHGPGLSGRDDGLLMPRSGSASGPVSATGMGSMNVGVKDESMSQVSVGGSQKGLEGSAGNSPVSTPGGSRGANRMGLGHLMD